MFWITYISWPAVSLTYQSAEVVVLMKIAAVFKNKIDPKPGLKFEHFGAPIPARPSRFRKEDGWSIELNNSTLPDVKIEKEYAQDLRKGGIKMIVIS